MLLNAWRKSLWTNCRSQRRSHHGRSRLTGGHVSELLGRSSSDARQGSAVGGFDSVERLESRVLLAAAPIINNLNGNSVAYSEQGTAVVIDQGTLATITHGDGDYTNGSLNVSYTSGGGQAGDTLGFGAGVTISGNNVIVGGNTIGTFSGGTDGTTLTVSFTNNTATTARVQTVIQNLNFQNQTDSVASGNRVLSFVLDDGAKASSAVSATVTVTGLNDAPAAQDVAAAADEDGTAVTTGFNADDGDSDDDPTSLTYNITSVLAAGEGSVTNNGDGTFTFDPGTDFQDLADGETRDVSFTYTATDSHAAVSIAATVTITVTGANDDPTAQDVAAAAVDGAAVTMGFDGDDGDSDDDSASLTYDITNGLGAGQGSLTNNGDGTFTFDPGTDFQDLTDGETREVSFTYTATDSHTAVSNTATVTITVTGVNNDPTAQDLAVAADEDGAAVTMGFDADDVDSDDDSASLTYDITSALGTGEGSVTNNGDGTFTFDPGADFQDLTDGETHDVSFTYTATDSHTAVSNTATVTTTITGVNDDPTAQDVVAAVADGTDVTMGFVADDVDSDDDPTSLTYDLTNAVAAGVGSMTNNGDGTFTFDPGTDFQDLTDGETREVSFTYTATDSHTAVSNTAAVTITVTGVNEDPTAQDVAVAAVEDGATVTMGFVADDVDSDDDPTSLVYDITSDLVAGEGTVTNNGDGTFTFDPGTDFQDLANGETREVSFTYTATDSHAAVSKSATVSITVTGVGGVVAISVNPSHILTLVDVEGTANDIRIVRNVAGTHFIISSTSRDLTLDGGPLTDSVQVLKSNVSGLSVTLSSGDDKLDLSAIGLRATVLGGDGDDSIIGSSGADRLLGELGNDTLNGGNGFDKILGGDGNDLIYGGYGNDTIDGEAGNDKILGQAGYDALRGGSGHDSLEGGIGHDTLLGGDGNDSLKGDDGMDLILGEDGVDTIWGGLGVDRLAGGGNGIARDPADLIVGILSEIDESFSFANFDALLV